MPERNEVLGHFGSPFSRLKAQERKSRRRPSRWYRAGGSKERERRSFHVLDRFTEPREVGRVKHLGIWRQVDVLIRRYYKSIDAPYVRERGDVQSTRIDHFQSDLCRGRLKKYIETNDGGEDGQQRKRQNNQCIGKRMKLEDGHGSL